MHTFRFSGLTSLCNMCDYLQDPITKYYRDVLHITLSSPNFGKNIFTITGLLIIPLLIGNPLWYYVNDLCHGNNSCHRNNSCHGNNSCYGITNKCYYRSRTRSVMGFRNCIQYIINLLILTVCSSYYANDTGY